MMEFNPVAKCATAEGLPDGVKSPVRFAYSFVPDLQRQPEHLLIGEMLLTTRIRMPFATNHAMYANARCCCPALRVAGNVFFAVLP